MFSKPSPSSDAPGMTGRAEILSRIAASGPFGFGASSLGNLYVEMDDAQAFDAVSAAWDAGVRLFDTAPFYGFGLSERRLGQALLGRPRDEFILSTKAGRLLEADGGGADGHGFRAALPFRPVFDYSYDGVMRSFEESLIRLQTDRIDILLLHDIGRATHGADHARRMHDAVSGGFRAMEHLREQNLVAAIGLGVNEVDICAESLDHVDLDIFLIANRYTLLDVTADAFFTRCAREGRGVLAAGVFSSGILATGSTGDAIVHFNYDVAPPGIMRRVAAIERACVRFGVRLPAAAHQFVRSHPGVTQTVLGLRDRAQLGEAVYDLDRRIPDEFWDQLRREELIGTYLVS